MQKTFKQKDVKFKYENGLNKAGKVKYAYNTFRNISETVSDETIAGMLPMIAKVQSSPSTEVEVVQVNILK